MWYDSNLRKFWNTKFICSSLGSIMESFESNSLTWIHPYIHVSPPFPSLTRVLFEGKLLWSASASVQWRSLHELALTTNERCKAARAGHKGFDMAQVRAPVARVANSWPPLGSLITGGIPNWNLSKASIKHSCCSSRQDQIHTYWNFWFEFVFPLIHQFLLSTGKELGEEMKQPHEDWVVTGTV